MESRIEIDQKSDQDRPVILDKSSVVRTAVQAALEISGSLGGVVRSDLRLATAEFKQAAAEFKSNVPAFFIASVIAILGVFPWMTFLVIGLGRVLGGNYWLSSLIVGLVFSGVGGLVAYRSLQKLKLMEMTLPRTRIQLLKEKKTLAKKVSELTLATSSEANRIVSHREAS